MDKEIRIALIMGGGVSLGSFSGGALARTIELLEHTERGPAKIDVVTGASAGSMTLGILIHHFLRGTDTPGIRTEMENAWVKEISFDRLCPPDMAKHGLAGLFTNAHIATIAGNAIKLDEPVGTTPHPLFKDGLRVSFALTNMNGVPTRAEGQIIRQADAGGAPTAGRKSPFADALQTTFHDDMMRFVVRMGAGAEPHEFERGYRVLPPWNTPAGRRAWITFTRATIASGAFPAAFPPVGMERRRREFGIWPDGIDENRFVFDYVDGGLLRNEPLREAIHLAALQDTDAGNFERVFILIDPHVSGTSEAFALNFNQVLGLKGRYAKSGLLKSWNLEEHTYAHHLVSVLARVGAVVAGQAMFQDWLKAARVNSQVEWRRELLPILRELNPDPSAEAVRQLDSLIRTVYNHKYRRPITARDMTDDERERRVTEAVERDLGRRMEEAGGNRTVAQLILIMDLIGNLREKQKLNMVAISPSSVPGDPLPLAGNFLANFGGFFDEEYRKYDFQVGEYAAWHVLSTTPPQSRSFLKPAARAATLARPVPEPDSEDPSYRHLPDHVRNKFEGMLSTHVRNMAETWAPWWIPNGLAARVATGLVRKTLLSSRNGATQNFRLIIGNADGHYLKGFDGANALARNGSIDTVVGTYYNPEWPHEDEFFGPQVARRNGKFGLELYESRPWYRRDRRVATLSFGGVPSDFAGAARVLRAPRIEVDAAALTDDSVMVPGCIEEGTVAETLQL